MPSAFTAGARARKPLPDVSCHSCLTNFLTWRRKLRLGHHVVRLETRGGDPLREWGHIQETRAAKLEDNMQRAKNLVSRDLKTLLWVKDLIISFVLEDTKG